MPSNEIVSGRSVGNKECVIEVHCKINIEKTFPPLVLFTPLDHFSHNFVIAHKQKSEIIFIFPFGCLR